MTAERLTAWTIDLPLSHPFGSASGQLHSRRLIVVRLELEGHTGFGEAAPVPGHTAETVATIWDLITHRDSARRSPDDPSLSGMAGAALAQARVDLAAKRAGVPLWRWLGGTQEVWASAAIGLDGAGQPDLAQLRSAVAGGYRQAKLKITGDVKPDVLSQARTLLPAGNLGLDANGSLAGSARSLLAQIDAQGFAYLEQPGPALDLASHVELRRMLDTPIALDESAHSPDAIQAILDTGAADIINLKAGRFGTSQTLQIAQQVSAAGTAVRLGGLIESGIGRAHTVALATCPEFSVANDIAGSDRYFVEDLVSPSWQLDLGRLKRPEQPGIGVAVDIEAVERFATARFVRE